ncbi:MAG: nucleoside-triphosphatase [Draconibacterium sp.]
MRKPEQAHIIQLNEKWIKASILGTVWASSEIVLGSFLHNLRIPFSGNILTAIGLIILISASYQWKEKGLFWRAGVICALLKTMSPSAVIFGPMIAIVSEAFLVEISVRIFGRTMAGFLLGSILAMSWNLFQKVFNFIIFYGFNIVEVYTQLMQYAERQLQLQFDAIWTPLLLLLTAYAVFGVFAAIVGIRTGRKLINTPASKQNFVSAEALNNNNKKRTSDFSYSLFWLGLNIFFMIGTLILVRHIPFWIWTIIVAAIAATWAIRYKRALKQLVKPKFWIFFALITMLTAFVFTKLQAEKTSLIEAVVIGVEMNFRAVILIMGFSVVGTELYHPKIRDFFSKSYFHQLPLALELSLESLPAMIANTPDLKTLIKNPVLVIHQMMLYAEHRLKELKSTVQNPKSIFITGKIGSGKTTLIKGIISDFQKEAISIAGFYSDRILKDGQTIGYDAVNISTGERMKLLRTESETTGEKIGKYFFYPEAFRKAAKLTKPESSQLFIIDEVGRLELREKGWFEILQYVKTNSKLIILLIVREEVIEDIKQKFGLHPEIVFHVNEMSTESIRSELFLRINSLLKG